MLLIYALLDLKNSVHALSRHYLVSAEAEYKRGVERVVNNYIYLIAISTVTVDYESTSSTVSLGKVSI